MGWMLDVRLSLLGLLRRLWSSFSGSPCVGVVFFPSLPFMGVMLFPSFRLGNAFGGGGASFVPHSLFFSLSSSTAFSSTSSSFFLPFSSVPIFFSSFLFSLSHPSFSSSYSVFLLYPFFFLRELLVLSAFQDVIEGTTDCNRM